jgi:phosphoribosylanthranilate isomerase
LLGADAIGLNFYAPSPRCVDLTTAAAILDRLPPLVEAVGLFVNQPLPRVLEALSPLPRIRTIQWHGDDPKFGDSSRFRLIRAFRVRDQQDLLGISRYLDICRTLGRLPAAVLVDAHVPGQYGGTGQCAPWHLLADFRPDVPVILAGGLTPENVAAGIAATRPFAVDTASGTEASPGRKDPAKMRAFFRAVGQAGPGEAAA